MYKAQLIGKIEEFIAANEFGGVSRQGNAFAAMDVLEEVRALNEMQACKLHRKIAEIETYDPAADKYGFGPRSVNVVDYAQFI